jgi:hypothetical protein
MRDETGCGFAPEQNTVDVRGIGNRILPHLFIPGEMMTSLHYAVGFLQNGMSSRQAESAAMSHGIETMALDRFALSQPDPNGIVIGFAAFDDHVIKRGVASLAIALSKREQ